MVFILLAEVIAFYIYIPVIKVGIPELKKLVVLINLISKAYWLVLSLLNVGLNKLLE